jgi:hypothetical protein
MEAAGPVETEAKILVLRDGQTQQFVTVADPDPEDREKAASEAQLRRAVFEHRARGAQTRAGLLPRSLTAALAGGTVNLMLAKLLQEEIVPATAKEAADVAKVAHEIFKSSAGVANPKDLTPAERKQKEDDVAALETRLHERARAATAQLGGALPEGVTPAAADEDDEPEVWEHEVPPSG